MCTARRRRYRSDGRRMQSDNGRAAAGTLRLTAGTAAKPSRIGSCDCRQERWHRACILWHKLAGALSGLPSTSVTGRFFQSESCMSSAAIPFTSRQLVWCVEKLRFPIPVPRLTTPWSRKRRQANLQQQLGFLAPVWENYREMMADYVASSPRAPQNPQADVLDCLQWLRGHGSRRRCSSTTGFASKRSGCCRSEKRPWVSGTASSPFSAANRFWLPTLRSGDRRLLSRCGSPSIRSIAGYHSPRQRY